MGADLIVAYLPDCKLSEARVAALNVEIDKLEGSRLLAYATRTGLIDLDEPDPDDPDDTTEADNIEQAREKLRDAVTEFADSQGRRDEVCLWLPLCPYHIRVTGGTSWGDEPTELFPIYAAIGGIDELFELLLGWAIEDRRQRDAAAETAARP